MTAAPDGISTSTPDAATVSKQARHTKTTRLKSDAGGLETGTSVSHSSADAMCGPKPGGALSVSGDKAPALQAMNGDPRSTDDPPAKSIWVCDGCFKYMRTYSGFRAHKRDCRLTHPPGRKVYQRGAHTIWEVDGAQQKLYAQNLSLFGKLFIDHKTIYFDVEPFVFYVLTDASSQFDHVLGYFSKEKISYDDYNLACIITFPPFQKHGFGTLMIEFSYYLSSLTSVLGTPERPLSDLGLKGYLSFWSAITLRTLALSFDDQDPDVKGRLLPSTYATGTPTKGRHQAQSAANAAALAEERQREQCVRLRKILLGLPSIPVVQRASSATSAGGPMAEHSDRTTNEAGRQARRSLKGWAGEVPKKRNDPRHSGSSDDALGSSDPVVLPEQEPHVPHELFDLTNDGSDNVTLQTTLDRLAEATNLRIEDLCFALSECGLLQRKKSALTSTRTVKSESRVENDEALQLVVSRDHVRQAIKHFNVKRPVLDVNYVLI